MIYFDGCYIAKYYLSEPDSAAVIAAARMDGEVACAAHGKVETAAVFHRKLREGVIGTDDYHLLRTQFEADCSAGLWSWFPVTPHLIDDTVRRFGILPGSVFLRTNDALHLASAAEHGFTSIHSSDKHLLAAAPHFGLTGITLPPPSQPSA
jgi:predicted nucleic acid-binding protein